MCWWSDDYMIGLLDGLIFRYVGSWMVLSVDGRLIGWLDD